MNKVQVLNHFQRPFLVMIKSEYAKNDKAHQWDHVVEVLSAANDIVNTFDDLIPYRDVILTAALLHDSKSYVNRAKHEQLAADWAISYLPSQSHVLASYRTLTPDEISLVGMCIRQHRASFKGVRTEPAAIAVAAADRGTLDFERVIKRALKASVESTRNKHPEHVIQAAIEHLVDKFGPDGYVWVGFPTRYYLHNSAIDNIKASLSDPFAVEKVRRILRERYAQWTQQL